jgi:hypothetical protein
MSPEFIRIVQDFTKLAEVVKKSGGIEVKTEVEVENEYVDVDFHIPGSTDQWYVEQALPSMSFVEQEERYLLKHPDKICYYLHTPIAGYQFLKNQSAVGKAVRRNIIEWYEGYIEHHEEKVRWAQRRLEEM